MGEAVRFSTASGVLAARAVVIASGARYRRLDIPNLAEFEMTGVHYWASAVETRLCEGQHATVLQLPAMPFNASQSEKPEAERPKERHAVKACLETGTCDAVPVGQKEAAMALGLHRRQHLSTRRSPRLGPRQGLALGTVTIATGVVGNAAMTAVQATLDVASQGRDYDRVDFKGDAIVIHHIHEGPPSLH